ncbi:TIR domain-containing protein [Amycolatopsis samaneae]|uniref:TIR domain-containing protein n=1 Tax=Amycolatopsis samaneae TaxID=664691 RepID=A0ABW5G9T8_9PSEU
MYEYDVFISYPREVALAAAWVRTHFYPRLLEHLDAYLDREVTVFFDENIPAGAKWPPTLQHALRRTRILVAVCAPKYFRSEWCMAEWQSMARREELVGRTSPEGTQSLIYPVIFCDSDSFPDYAHQRRMRDFNDLNHPEEHFQMSPRYLDFRSEVGRIAEELEKLIERAPAWQPDWPLDTPLPEKPPTAKLPRF